MIESVRQRSGLAVLAPGTPQDAYDLLVEAAHLDDPVLFPSTLDSMGYVVKTGCQNINQKVDTSSVHTSIEQGKRHYGKAPRSSRVKMSPS